jgi:hypothetical protein
VLPWLERRAGDAMAEYRATFDGAIHSARDRASDDLYPYITTHPIAGPGPDRDPTTPAPAPPTAALVRFLERCRFDGRRRRALPRDANARTPPS